MEKFKNQAKFNPCAACPKQLGCPFLIFDAVERRCYCSRFQDGEKEHYESTGYEPFRQSLVPYFAN